LKIALYPGTFDPITLGHMDVIKAGAKLFDEVIIAVGDNTSKTPMFDIDKRVQFIQDSIKKLYGNISVMSYETLTADLAQIKGVDVILRGSRLPADYEMELNLAFNNTLLNDILPYNVYSMSAPQTIIILPVQEHIHISSSAVRELIRINRHELIYKYVPESVYRSIILMYQDV
jgi:pantetheine-phosphate adenylyltransferase